MKTQKTLKTITKAAFDKLPNPAKRVLIAQDVITQLDAKKFVQNRGNYFEFKITNEKAKKYDWEKGERYDPLEEIRLDDKSAKVLIEDSKCYVCAKGATICSFVQKFNEKTTGSLDYNDRDLVEIFGSELWEELEDHFEGFGKKRKSLRQLMNNIIKNKGYLKINKVLIG